ncbi:MAG: hypothetical protein E7252_05050 [Lachnospira sp.]|nr:hypothetical protein [Lachnospira sp.]
MCYDGALVMPSSYAVMSEEEMTYVEGGGWSTYKGMEAIMGITAMIGCSAAFMGISKSIVASMVATAATGIGLLATIALAGGLSLSLAISAYQGTLALAAAVNMVNSYSKTKSFNKSGYKACSYGIWTFSVFTQVASL